MKRAIWKYRFGYDGQTVFDIPKGSRLLTVQDRGGRVTMWAQVDPAAPVEPRTFVIRGTGQQWDHDDMGEYIGTAQVGGFVWHAYEVTT